MKLRSLFFTLLLGCLAAAAQDSEMDEFITDLMSRMTLEEKLGQINLPPAGDIVTGMVEQSNIAAAAAKGQIGGTFNVKGAEKVYMLQRLAVEKSRLGIPLLVGMDVIHGYETVFPIPLAMACTWDPETVRQAARIAAREASAAGVNWTFSPMVDICRDGRWGRIMEGAGEDPYLGSVMAAAMVRGYQGENMQAPDEIMACVKHFALYGAAEAGRDYNTVDMSRFRMFNDYFPPYKAVVDAGVGSVMTSFNLVDGIPATANKWLLTDVLRDKWGFKGLIVTDFASINEMRSHGYAERPLATIQTLKAGTDMDMSAWAFVADLPAALEQGKVTMEQIDAAVRHVLEAKYKLGLFANPYKYNNVERERTDIYTPENRAIARRTAAESFVLLRNEGSLLPVAPKGKIALVGPMGNNRTNMAGSWSVAEVPDKYKTVLEGLRDAVGDAGEVVYAKGCNIYADASKESGVSFDGKSIRDDRSEDELLAEALEVVADADIIIAAMGEMAESSGESSSRCELELPETQRRLLEAMLATGKPVVMLNFAGRPTVMTWESEHVPAILNVWFGGSETADAIADVVFGKTAPEGRLVTSMPRSTGQLPLYYNHMNTGRPVPADAQGFVRFLSNYIDVPSTPLYPFGYGLTYTDFSFSGPTLSADRMDADGSIEAAVTVTNTGARAGVAVVQWYIRDVLSTMVRPVKELKHFERVALEPGQSRTVTFEITEETLKYYNYDLDFVAEPGEFVLMVGPDSERVSAVNFTLE